MHGKTLRILFSLLIFSVFLLNADASTVNNNKPKEQIVINKTDETEVFYKDFAEKIKNADSIIILAHINPDGDALGSAIALKIFIWDVFKKPSRIVYSGVLSNAFSFLPQFDELENAENISKDEKFSLAIAIDVSSLDRLHKSEEIYKNADFRVNIDHHRNNNGLGELNLVDENACSAGFILFKMFNNAGYEIKKPVATALYTSIMTDTGSFKYENTTPECLRVAAQLVEAGVVPKEIFRACYETKPVDSFRFQLFVLNRAEYFKDGKIAIASATQEDIKKFRAKREYFDEIPDILRTIDTVDVSVLLHETKNGDTRAEIRSKYTDIVPIAVSFGGGGHTFAGGCTIKKPLNTAKKQLLKRLRKAVR